MAPRCAPLETENTGPVNWECLKMERLKRASLEINQEGLNKGALKEKR